MNILGFLFAVSFFSPLWACSCLSYPPFFEVAPETELVILGEVSRHEENSLYLVVEDVLSGEETRKEIRIWGDTGDLCRPYVSKFPPGTTWVFAVFPVSPKVGRGNAWFGWGGRKTDYAISGCGEFALAVEGEHVTGYLKRSRGMQKETMSLQELIQIL